MPLKVRSAVPADAAGIVAVLAVVAAERVYSAIDRAWTVEEEGRFLTSLSPREVVHVAVIQVRGSNTGAQAFYRRLGFQDCGQLARQVIIDDVEDDEVLMERFV